MPEPVPLRARLRVEGQAVVVDDARRGGAPDEVLGPRAAKERVAHLVERPVGADAGPVADLVPGDTGGIGGREEIERAELVVGPEEAPGVASGSVLDQGEGVKGGAGGHGSGGGGRGNGGWTLCSSFLFFSFLLSYLLSHL